MIKTKAIVLGRKDLHDYDSLIFCYSLDFGRINLVAKGLKKSGAKLAGHLEPFNLIDLMIIKGRQQDYVGSAIAENSFLNIKSDYDRLDLAGQAFRFLQELIFTNQADFNIFLIIRDFLSGLDEVQGERKKGEPLLTAFKLKLLKLLGYDFNLKDCSRCRREQALYFDFFNREVLGLKCSTSVSNNFIKINSGTADLKEDLLSGSFFELSAWKISEKDLKNLNQLIEVIKKTI